MKDLRIVFMGTPEFAIPSLNILIENGYNVVAVITTPDKPRGRGRKLTPTPVKEQALKNNIPVLQPANLKDPGFIDELKEYSPDLQIVVAFRMLPDIVWTLPPYGTVNLHASLLPQYRGAAPINWALINGEDITGLTTFFIKHEIDTGNIILQQEVEIYPEDNAGTLHDRLKIKGADIVLETVRLIEKGNFKIKKQVDEPGLKKAPKISRETCQIDWNSSMYDLYNFVRGLSPYPTAWTRINDKLYKIYRISITDSENFGQPGEYLTDNKTFLNFQCLDGVVSVDEIQPEGKRKMMIEEFFRGNSL